jgi:hypothetical protein
MGDRGPEEGGRKVGGRLENCHGQSTEARATRAPRGVPRTPHFADDTQIDLAKCRRSVEKLPISRLERDAASVEARGRVADDTLQFGTASALASKRKRAVAALQRPEPDAITSRTGEEV